MACVDAALARAPADDVTLLHVTDAGAVDAAHGAFTALLGRAGAGPGAQLEAMAETAATEVLEAAAARLGRAARQQRRRGRPEHEVVQAARGADLLIVARQGAAEAGPRSLGKAARFVVEPRGLPGPAGLAGARPGGSGPAPGPAGRGRPKPPHGPGDGPPQGPGGGPPPAQRLE